MNVNQMEYATEATKQYTPNQEYSFHINFFYNNNDNNNKISTPIFYLFNLKSFGEKILQAILY